MKESDYYTSFDELPAILNAEELATALRISRAGAYKIMHRADFKALHIGKRLFAKKDDLLEWIRKNSCNQFWR